MDARGYITREEAKRLLAAGTLRRTHDEWGEEVLISAATECSGCAYQWTWSTEVWNRYCEKS